jgi:hypothetical protein
MKKKLRTLVLLSGVFVLLVVSSNLKANEYDLEIVVFLNNGNPGTELPRHGSERHAKLNEKLQKLSSRTGSITPLPVSLGKMQGLVENLNRDPSYTVLQHVTWRQEVPLISDAPYIDISALTIGDDGSGLSGTLRFYHSPLLYVDVLLKYVPFSDPELVAAPIVNSFGEVVQDVPTAIEIAYYLDEKRRVKLTDLHYLDSSNIGAIISVWPIDDAIE